MRVHVGAVLEQYVLVVALRLLVVLPLAQVDVDVGARQDGVVEFGVVAVRLRQLVNRFLISL